MDNTAAGAKRVAGGGFAAGAAAWVLGYLAVYVTSGSDVENSMGSTVLELLTDESVTWKLVGWLFFNAHNVTVTVPGVLGDTARNFLTGAEGSGSVVLLAIPPVLLVLGGVAAAWDTAEAPTTAARNGAAVALGYLPLSIAGAGLFAVPLGTASAGPTLVTAVLLAGVVYPLVFGAVGGLVGGHLSAE